MRVRLSVSTRLRRLSGVLRDTRGTSTIEYALILAFIVLMMFGALTQLAETNRDMWIDIKNRVVAAK
jgi:Flp pilus assembly pilin Flp